MTEPLTSEPRLFQAREFLLAILIAAKEGHVTHNENNQQLIERLAREGLEESNPNATPGATFSGEASVSLPAEASRPRELLTSKPQFARGTVRARVAAGNGNIRIEGSITASKRVKGLAMHPNTARALGEWLLSVTVRSAAPVKMSWEPCSTGGLWVCEACGESYCAPPWGRGAAENDHGPQCTGVKTNSAKTGDV